MSTPSGVIDAQLQSLLDLVQAHREERCHAIIEQARQQAHEILRQAHTDARQRMHSAVQEERVRAHEQLAAARAQLQTRSRHQRHQTALLLLERAWGELRNALRQRWRDREARAGWIEAILRQAVAALPPRPWRIEHPAGWESAELGPILQHVPQAIDRPEFRANEGIDAGLLIVAGSAHLDGTIQGLLTDRPLIESLLLTELNRLLALQQPEEAAP